MYGLVPFNLSPIQQGIQYGHGVVEYTNKYFNSDERLEQWMKEDKTFIILNGGTTNTRIIQETLRPVGTLNEQLETLKQNGVKHATFYEPDLGDQLTAIVFLVDDRVFDKETYPDFNWDLFLPDPAFQHTQLEYQDIRYREWLVKIGGFQNEFLRDFLLQFNLA